MAATEPPKVVQGQPVSVERLQAMPWVQNGNSWVAFRVRSVIPMSGFGPGAKPEDRWARIDLADLGLAQTEPLTEHPLRNTLGSVHRVVMWTHPIGANHPAYVLGGESLAERLALSELGWHLGRGDELIPRSPLTAGALLLDVVRRQARTAAAVPLPPRPRPHSSHGVPPPFVSHRCRVTAGRLSPVTTVRPMSGNDFALVAIRHAPHALIQFE